MLDTASVHTVWGAVFPQGLSSWPDTAETAIRLLRRLGEPGRGAGGAVPWVLDSVSWPKYLAHALAFRGHLRGLRGERLLRQPSASPWSLWFDTFHDLSLLGIVPDSLARAASGRSLESAAGWADEFQPRHLRGLPWWLSRGDTVALARFAARAARAGWEVPAPRAALRARLLGETSVAFLDLAHGQFRRGDSEAERDPRHALPGGRRRHLLPPEPDAGAAPRGFRGEDRQAGALLDRWRWSGDGTPSFVLATLELGRIAERLGETGSGRAMASCRRPAAGRIRSSFPTWRKRGKGSRGSVWSEAAWALRDGPGRAAGEPVPQLCPGLRRHRNRGLVGGGSSPGYNNVFYGNKKTGRRPRF